MHHLHKDFFLTREKNYINLVQAGDSRPYRQEALANRNPNYIRQEGNMNSIQELEFILTRLRKSPAILARSELQMFRNIVDHDHSLSTILWRIIQENAGALGGGPKAASIVKQEGNSGNENLDFAHSQQIREGQEYHQKVADCCVA